MSEITGVSVTLTNQSGEHLCEESPCNSAPCLHGGACSATNTTEAGYECACTAGYQGVNCEMDIDECAEGKG